MKKAMYTEFIQDIDLFLYLGDWFPARYKKTAQKINEAADDEEKLLSLQFGRAECAVIGNAAIRYALSEFPGREGHQYAYLDLNLVKGTMRAYHFSDKKLHNLDEIDTIVNRYIDGAYDAMIWQKEQRELRNR